MSCVTDSRPPVAPFYVCPWTGIFNQRIASLDGITGAATTYFLHVTHTGVIFVSPGVIRIF